MKTQLFVQNNIEKIETLLKTDPKVLIDLIINDYLNIWNIDKTHGTQYVEEYMSNVATFDGPKQELKKILIEQLFVVYSYKVFATFCNNNPQFALDIFGIDVEYECLALEFTYGNQMFVETIYLTSKLKWKKFWNKSKLNIPKKF